MIFASKTALIPLFEAFVKLIAKPQIPINPGKLFVEALHASMESKEWMESPATLTTRLPGGMDKDRTSCGETGCSGEELKALKTACMQSQTHGFSYIS